MIPPSEDAGQPKLRVREKPTFRKAAKKLCPVRKEALDQTVRGILANPEAGEAKIGDLAGVRVVKFRAETQLWLLAYSVGEDVITLLALGSHENFDRDLKR